MALVDVLLASESARTPRIKRWLVWCEIQTKWRLLRNLAEEEMAAWNCLSMFQGEMATYYCEQDISVMFDEQTELKDELRELVDQYTAMGGKIG